MNAKEFIEKWLVGYEDLEHKAELSIEMETDLIKYANQPKKYSEDIANKAIQKNKITKYIPIFKDVIKTYLQIESQTIGEKP